MASRVRHSEAILDACSPINQFLIMMTSPKQGALVHIPRAHYYCCRLTHSHKCISMYACLPSHWCRYEYTILCNSMFEQEVQRQSRIRICYRVSIVILLTEEWAWLRTTLRRPWHCEDCLELSLAWAVYEDVVEKPLCNKVCSVAV